MMKNVTQVIVYAAFMAGMMISGLVLGQGDDPDWENGWGNPLPHLCDEPCDTVTRRQLEVLLTSSLPFDVMPLDVKITNITHSHGTLANPGGWVPSGMPILTNAQSLIKLTAGQRSDPLIECYSNNPIPFMQNNYTKDYHFFPNTSPYPYCTIVPVLHPNSNIYMLNEMQAHFGCPKGNPQFPNSITQGVYTFDYEFDLRYPSQMHVFSTPDPENPDPNDGVIRTYTGTYSIECNGSFTSIPLQGPPIHVSLDLIANDGELIEDLLGFGYPIEFLTGGRKGFSDEHAHLVNIQVYPNPAQDEAILSLNLIEKEGLTIEVFDIQGRVVKSVLQNEQVNQGEHKFQVSLHNIPSGVYFVKIKGVNWSERVKLIKM